MSDIQLFRIASSAVEELEPRPAALESTLQRLFEKHLDALLGVRFLASEFSTGPVHRGRIDTLGLDEDGAPVIIEYKRAVNENVISQGLYYLDWLFDHRGDFAQLVQRVLGLEAVAEVDWSAPRLICIAGDYTRYDLHAVRQIQRNIDLVRFKQFGPELLLVELVHSVQPDPVRETAAPVRRPANAPGPLPDVDLPEDLRDTALVTTTPELRQVFVDLRAYLLGLGEDVNLKVLKSYFAFRRLRNFVTVRVFPRMLVLNAALDPATVEHEGTRDVSELGNHGRMVLEIVLRSAADFEKARPLLVRAYEGT